MNVRPNALGWGIIVSVVLWLTGFGIYSFIEWLTSLA